MRLARIIGALVALILTASLGQALVSPADAMAKPKHSIKGLRGGEVGHTNHFYIKGKVATFPKGKIRVLRNVAGGRYDRLQEDQDQVQRQVPHLDQPGRQQEDLLQGPGPGHHGLQEDHLEGHRLHRIRLIFRTYGGLAPAGAGPAAFGSCRVLPSRGGAG